MSRLSPEHRETDNVLGLRPTPFSAAKSPQLPKIALRLWLPHISMEAYTGNLVAGGKVERQKVGRTDRIFSHSGLF